MKIKRSTRKINKPIIVTTAILLVVLAAFFTYAFFFKPHDNKPTGTDQPKGTSSNDQQSVESKTDLENKEKAPNTDTPATPTTSGESTKKQVQMVASVDKSDNTVFIRGGVNYPVSGGECYAQLTGPSGQTIRKNSDALPNPASTDCKTISIPVSNLASGKWSFTLHYTSNEYEGASVEVSFTI